MAKCGVLTFRLRPSLKELVDFVRSIDNDVVPPVNSRVSIDEYCEKLDRFADCIIAEVDNQLVGLCAMYCNNHETREGFVSLIAVDAQFRRQGLGALLLDKGMDLAMQKGMERVSLETNVLNHKAVSLYISKGFAVDHQNADGSIFLSRDLRNNLAIAV